MKAEHRKELETNVLADRMGRMVQRMKSKPQTRSVLYFILALIVLIILFLTYQYYKAAQNELAKDWLKLEFGEKSLLEDLSGFAETKTKQGNIQLIQSEKPALNNTTKAARLQIAHFYLWERGIKVLGADSRGALISMSWADEIYSGLVKDCEGEPLMQSEAEYGLAIIEETRAVQRPERLKVAQARYEEIASKYKDTGFGKLAEKRARDLKDNQKALTDFYQDLQTKFRVPLEEKAPAEKKLLP